MKDGEIISRVPFPSPNPRVALYLITMWSAGLKVKGLLAEPEGNENLDGFLYLRGGIKNVGMVRPSRIAQFADQGFIVFAPYYRGNRGGEGNEDFAGEDREDAFSGVRLLQQHPRVLNHKIHVFGFSRGGVMALQAGVEFSSIASVVTWGGVSDLTLTYEERKDLRRMMKRVIGGTPAKKEDAYKYRTPLYELEAMKAPVLIIHGAKDTNVTIEHAYRLEKRMKELNKKVETMYYEEFDHVFPPVYNRKTVKELCSWMKMQKADFN
ncbi:prolyl oligopeptidase family serine peptidase [Jeotgalibacillus sp. ET6]|uniref:alpha/beta hydrolase family protein n=1 Tax=Jeotgalibacillus sp. ET6 TaxID=3037260 RepID=UPI002418417A|nr:prolyl oligopeptidase family serine peptidase [Jeotgalibacillus sp. ET6]MDG5473558.1 prolyl oligopeptidase family serine peptidase [Jeotgalibacillus sp. ET6]